MSRTLLSHVGYGKAPQSHCPHLSSFWFRTLDSAMAVVESVNLTSESQEGQTESGARLARFLPARVSISGRAMIGIYRDGLAHRPNSGEFASHAAREWRPLIGVQSVARQSLSRSHGYCEIGPLQDADLRQHQHLIP